MDRYIINIIKSLNDTTYTSIDNLAYQLGVSQRTIRNSINQFDSSKHGFLIQYKSKKGYFIDVFDKKKYYQFIKDDLKKELESQLLIPVYNEQRINYIIRKFLSENKEIKLEDLADELYVSRSTINRLIKEVKLKFKEYHLNIVNPKGKGLLLSGNELHYRSCIAHYYYRPDSYEQYLYFDQFDYQEHQEDQNIKKIQNIVYQILLKHQFKLTDIGFQNLIVHLVIAINRSKETTTQDINQEIYQKMTLHKEYKIACEIASRMEDEYSIELDEIEAIYITIHLLSKKVVNDVYVASEENTKLINLIYQRINDEMHLDFTKDIDLHTFLLLHLDPLMVRLRFGLKMINPLLNEIKTENVTAFEIAVVATKELSKQTGFKVPEEEIGYLALHFALALERIHVGKTKKRIIVVCASGAGTSRLLRFQLQKRFDLYLEDILTTELYSLPSIHLEDYDYLFTTVPIPFEVDIPVVQITNFLSMNDIQNIETVLKTGITNRDSFEHLFDQRLFYTDLYFKNKNDVIHYLCHQIGKYYSIPDNFEQLVLDREKIAVTELGNYVALPHPSKLVSDLFFIAIALLKKPLIWDQKLVKYIFLISMPSIEDTKNEMITQAIAQLIIDEQALTSLEQIKTLPEFVQLLKGYIS